MGKNLQINKSFSLLLVLIVIFSVIYFSIISSYVSQQIDKSYINWQNKISILSEVKIDNLKKWFEQKDSAVQAVSENITVKLYLTEYGDKKFSNKTSRDDKLVQQQFLGSYLSSEAQKAGFVNSLNSSGKIRANIKQESDAALVILDKFGDVVAAKDFEENLQQITAQYTNNLKKLKLYKTIISSNNLNYYIGIKSIEFVQSNEVAGYVLAVKKIGDELESILNFPPESYETSNSALIVKNEGDIRIVSSIPEIARMGVVNFSSEVESPEISAVKNPNEILVRSDGKKKVIIIAKQLSAGVKDSSVQPWFLIYKIAEAEALRDAFAIRKSIIYTSIFLFIAIILSIFLAWRHSSSIKYQNLYKTYEEQNRLLKLVTENQIQKMFILDSGNILRFANENFAKLFNLKAKDLDNKSLESVVGPSAAEEYTAISSRIEGRKKPLVISKKTKEDSKDKYIQRKFIPISKVPSGIDSVTNGTLIIENDITQIVSERIKKENNLDETIKMLIKIMEERSIYYHNHSENVTKLCRKLALNLELEEKEVRALEIAARLSNLYLVLLPSEILNKKAKLTKDEQKMFDACPAKTIELIKQIDFDAPVLNTIEQSQERPDGKGVMKLKEKDIASTAKILRTANDFVAMTSPRAYRKSLTAKQAIDEMLKARGKKYSENIVYALANIVSK